MTSQKNECFNKVVACFLVRPLHFSHAWNFLSFPLERPPCRLTCRCNTVYSFTIRELNKRRKYEDLGTVHTSCFCSTKAPQKQDKSTAEARCLHQSFEFGLVERSSLLLDLILGEQLSSTVVCIIYGCQRSASWRHVYKHTFCIQTYILDWTSPLGLFRNNNKGDKNSLVLMSDGTQILFHECD